MGNFLGKNNQKVTTKTKKNKKVQLKQETEKTGLDQKAHQPTPSDDSHLTEISGYRSIQTWGIEFPKQKIHEIQAHPFRSTTKCVQNPDPSTDTPEEEQEEIVTSSHIVE